MVERLKLLELYLHSQCVCAERLAEKTLEPFCRRYITISRQTGAGGITIAGQVADIINREKKTSCECPWTVFDKGLVKEVLKEHRLPQKFACPGVITYAS